MEKIILTNVSLDELADKIVEKLTSTNHEITGGKQKENAKEYLSVDEAAELIQLAVPTIYGLTHRNIIPFIKRGKKLYFKRTDLINWLDSGRRHTKEELRKIASERLEQSSSH